MSLLNLELKIMRGLCNFITFVYLERKIMFNYLPKIFPLESSNMKKIKYTLNVWLIVICSVLTIQAQTLVSGIVTDANSGESLIGATILVQETGKGISTDFDGRYELSLQPGTYQFVLSYIGYDDLSLKVLVTNTPRMTFDIKMGESTSILDVITVTGSQVEKKFTEETVSIDVISPEFIQGKNNTSLSDAIQRVPGVEVIDGQPNIRSGSGYAYGAGSRVVILVDDQPMLAADNSDVKWNFIPIENAAQVEIIKGSSSVLYGSAALNGVINVRLARATETPYTYLSMYSGLYDNFRDTSQIWWGSAIERPYQTGVYMAHRQKLNKNLGLVLGGNIHFLKGYLKDADEERARFNFNLRYNPPKNDRLSYGIAGNIMYHKIGNFFLWGSDSTQHYVHIDDPISGDAYSTSSLDPWLTYFDKFSNKHTFKTRYFDVTKLRGGNNALAKIFSLEYRYQREFAKKLNLTAGGQAQYFYAKSVLFGKDSLGNFPSENGYTYAAYAQLDKKLFDKLNTTLGMRWEAFHVSGESIAALPVFRLGLNYPINRTNFLRASFGQGYRVPSLAERFIDDDITDGVFIFPNPELKPESGWSTELGYKKVIDKGKKWNGYIDVAAFLMEYRDMTEFLFDLYVPAGVEVDPLTALQTYLGFKAVNISRARIAGMEFTVFGEGHIKNIPTRLWAGYTYSFPGDLGQDTTLVGLGNFMNRAVKNFMQIDSAESGGILKYRSLHTTRLDWEIDPHKNLTIGIAANYKSFVYNIDDVLEGGGKYGSLVSALVPALKRVREFREAREGKGDWLVDFRLAYRFDDNHQLTFSVNNALNREYTLRAAKPGPPRLYNVKYQMMF